MADQKITELVELTSVDTADLVAIVDDPAGTPVTKKITVANLTESGDRLLGKFDLDAYDTIIASLLPDIEAYQDTYILSNPRYFQGLETHSVTPKDDTTADRLTVAPAGKTTTWQDTNLISTALPFSIKIDEYRTPDNQLGYTVIFMADDGVDLWFRAVGYGPASVQKTYTWRKKVPE